ncbi:MAG: proline dehydrogenase family protein [Rhodothermales bacterium]
MRLPFFLAKRFVAAETIGGMLPVAADLKQQGLLVTLDLLGEYIKDPKLALEAKKSYIDLIRAVDETDLAIDRNISIKLSMLGQKIDPSFCMDNLLELLSVAKETGTFVRLDMEGTDVTDLTLDMFEKVYPDYRDNVGVVLQAYLKRTAEDVTRMCELNARVRLCKGAYKEPASLAWQDMPTIREHYLAYMQQLITHGRYPGIATHDDILMAETKTFVQENNIPASDFEFQMLYGIRPETQLAIMNEGYNMRVYVPFGTKWVPYFSRRLRERKENVWFILKNLFKR